ncbi:MAG: hypothetical protein ACYC2G_03185 [Gemmatimonadaceae bacterium]
MHNADVVALARLAHQYGTPHLSPDAVERLTAETAVSRRVELEHAVPLEIRYQCAEVRDGALVLHPDVYGLASHPPRRDVLVALAAAGIGTIRIPVQRVDELVRLARAGTVILLNDSLRVVPPCADCPCHMLERSSILACRAVWRPAFTFREGRARSADSQAWASRR